MEVGLHVSCWGNHRIDIGQAGNSLSLLLILKEKQLWESIVLPAESGEGKEKSCEAGCLFVPGEILFHILQRLEGCMSWFRAVT